MSFTYSTKELQILEKMLEKKLFDLKVSQASAKTPPSEFDELSLTTNILKFVQYLVNKELSNMGFWRQSPLADPHGSPLYHSLSQNSSSLGVSLQQYTTSTICENCRQKNPSNTHCVHNMVGSDAQDYGDCCDFGTTIEQIKAIKVEK